MADHDIVMEGYHGSESLGMLSRSFQELRNVNMSTCQRVAPERPEPSFKLNVI